MPNIDGRTRQPQTSVRRSGDRSTCPCSHNFAAATAAPCSPTPSSYSASPQMRRCRLSIAVSMLGVELTTATTLAAAAATRHLSRQ